MSELATSIRVMEDTKVDGLRHVRWNTAVNPTVDLVADLYEIATTDKDLAAGDVRLVVVLPNGERSAKHSYLLSRQKFDELVRDGRITQTS